MKGLYHNLKPVSTILPIVGNNDTEGTGIGVDLQGYEGALIVAHFGVSGDTLAAGLNVLPVLQESDSLSTGYTAVAAADMHGAFTIIDDAAEDDVVQVVGYVGSKRFIRLFNDFTGTHTVGIPMSAVVIVGRARHAPVTATQTP